MGRESTEEVPNFLEEGAPLSSPPPRRASATSAVSHKPERLTGGSISSTTPFPVIKPPESSSRPYTEPSSNENRVSGLPKLETENLRVPRASNEGSSHNFPLESAPQNEGVSPSYRSEGSRHTPRTGEIPNDPRGEEPNLLPDTQEHQGGNHAPTAVAGVVHENVPFGGPSARELGPIEVASLIINKMIGTGIVTGPAQVLLYTKRKDYALLLWCLGYIYTLVSVFIFVEFGYAFKVTGGELVYLDEIFTRRRLLPAAIFSFQFVLFWNTATNCAQAARQIIICADRSLDSRLGAVIIPGLGDTLNEFTKSIGVFPNDSDTRLNIFIALVILATVCLLHYFSTAAGRATNVLFAIYKVMLLLVLFGRGVWFAARHGFLTDWAEIPQGEEISWNQYANAILAILFAYQGWENASFVAGEVERNTKALRNGYYLAVTVVGLLYILVNVGFLTAFELVIEPTIGKIDIKTLASDGFAARLWGTAPSLGDVNAARVDASPVKAWAILLMLSALGNVLAVTYTCGRVKQMIGQAFIFPWSRLWARESRFNTPSGGLLLHGICSAVLIIIAVSVGQIGLPGYLQAYSHAIVASAVTFAFWFFTPPAQQSYQWSWMGNNWWRWLVTFVSFIMNLAMIALPLGSVIPDLNVNGGKIFGGSCFTAVGVSILYYFMLFPVENYNKSLSRVKHFSLLRIINVNWRIDNVEPEIYEERWRRFKRTTRYFDEELTEIPYKEEQLLQFGIRRTVYYEFDETEPSAWKRWIFWFFGGSFVDTGVRNPRASMSLPGGGIPLFSFAKRDQNSSQESVAEAQ